MPERRRSKIVYITSHGKVGSTALGILLGNHSRLVSLGEVDRVWRYGETMAPHKTCSCGVPVSECEFWSSVGRHLRQRNGARGRDESLRDFWINFRTERRVPTGLLANRLHLLEILLALGSEPLLRLAASANGYIREFMACVENSWRLFDAVAEIQGAEFIVDGSGDPARMKMLQITRPDDIWVIHMVRDGRAHILSDKKRGETSAAASIRRWRRRTRNITTLVRTVPPKRVRRLRYEDLCRNTETELGELCDFLSTDFEPAMLDLASRTLHDISGSRMRMDPEMRQELRLDESWRNELDRGELETFDRLGGELNRGLGYS